MDVVALLPMKGHSERVPGKNLRPLAGRPLYHWILDTLLSVPAISRVVIDTDSGRIADDVAASFPSTEVRERPQDLLGDDVPMHDIVARFVTEYSDGELLLQTHSTNPLLSAETLSKAIEVYLGDGDHDSLMSVTEWRTRFYDDRGHPVNHDPDVLLRTQDLDTIYEENSNIYIAPRDVIMRTGRRVGSKPILFPVGRIESTDIDEEIDFVIAECVMRWRQGG